MLVIISDSTRNIFSLSLPQCSKKSLICEAEEPYGIFRFKVLGCVIVSIWSVIIFILLQDVQFRIENDLILSCPNVKYFMDFNTKRRICSPESVTQAKIDEEDQYSIIHHVCFVASLEVVRFLLKYIKYFT